MVLKNFRQKRLLNKSKTDRFKKPHQAKLFRIFLACWNNKENFGMRGKKCGGENALKIAKDQCTRTRNSC